MISKTKAKPIYYGLLGKKFFDEFVKEHTQPIECIKNGVEVVNPAAFVVEFDDGHQLQVAINGGISNMASIPHLFRWLIKPTDKYLRAAAVVHDILINEFSNIKPNKRAFSITRPHNTDLYIDEKKYISAALCDKIFKHIIIDGAKESLNPRTALLKGYLCYFGVRAWSIVTFKFNVKPN